MSSPPNTNSFLTLNHTPHRPSVDMNREATTAITSSPDLKALDQAGAKMKSNRSDSTQSDDSVVSLGNDEVSKMQGGQFLKLGQN